MLLLSVLWDALPLLVRFIGHSLCKLFLVVLSIFLVIWTNLSWSCYCGWAFTVGAFFRLLTLLVLVVGKTLDTSKLTFEQ